MLSLLRPLMLIGIAAPAVANPFAPEAESSPVAIEQATEAGALQLARLLNPDEPMAELARRSFDKAFDEELAADGSIGELEKEHPGFLAELRNATRDVVLADLKADMPAVHQRYARFFADHFTPEEIAELNSFYGSPAGARIIQAKFANLELPESVRKIAADDNAQISPEHVEAVNQSAISATWKGMSADDMQALLLFGLSPVARKLQNSASALAEIEAAIANEPDPELDAAIEAATLSLYERYGLGD